MSSFLPSSSENRSLHEKRTSTNVTIVDAKVETPGSASELVAAARRLQERADSDRAPITVFLRDGSTTAPPR